MGKRSREAEKNHWIELARTLAIEYVPLSKIKGNGQHRLVGYINGFLTVIKLGIIQQANRPIYGVVIRYADLMNPEVVEKNLLEKPEVNELRGKLKSQKRSFEVREDYAWIVIPYNYKKDALTEIAGKINRFVNILAVYTRPLSSEMCEAKNCRVRLDEKPNLVFVNEFPQMLCENCIAEIPTAARKAQEEFRKAPARLSRGIMAGIGVAFLGSILWAFVAVFLDRIAAILAALMLFGIIKVMDKIGTKRTIWSGLAAALLSVGGVIFGTYLTIILYNIKEYSAAVSADLLSKAWRYLWSKPDLLFLPLFFCLLGVLPFLWLVWSSTRRGLSLVFNPKVEIIEKNF